MEYKKLIYRDEVLKRIEKLVFANDPSSVWIQGGRCSGKTKILEEFQKRVAEKAYTVVLKTDSDSGFYSSFYEALPDEIKPKALFFSKPDENYYKKMIKDKYSNNKKANKKGYEKPTLVFIDNIDSNEYKPDFKYIRELTQYGVRFIISSRTPMEDVIVEVTKSSFSIAAFSRGRIILEPLNEEEISEVLNKTTLDETAREQIVRISGGMPPLLDALVNEAAQQIQQDEESLIKNVIDNDCNDYHYLERSFEALIRKGDDNAYHIWRSLSGIDDITGRAALEKNHIWIGNNKFRTPLFEVYFNEYFKNLNNIWNKVSSDFSARQAEDDKKHNRVDTLLQDSTNKTINAVQDSTAELTEKLKIYENKLNQLVELAFEAKECNDKLSNKSNELSKGLDGISAAINDNAGKTVEVLSSLSEKSGEHAGTLRTLLEQLEKHATEVSGGQAKQTSISGEITEGLKTLLEQLEKHAAEVSDGQTKLSGMSEKISSDLAGLSGKSGELETGVLDISSKINKLNESLNIVHDNLIEHGEEQFGKILDKADSILEKSDSISMKSDNILANTVEVNEKADKIMEKLISMEDLQKETLMNNDEILEILERLHYDVTVEKPDSISEDLWNSLDDAYKRSLCLGEALYNANKTYIERKEYDDVWIIVMAYCRTAEYICRRYLSSYVRRCKIDIKDTYGIIPGKREPIESLGTAALLLEKMNQRYGNKIIKSSDSADINKIVAEIVQEDKYYKYLQFVTEMRNACGHGSEKEAIDSPTLCGKMPELREVVYFNKSDLLNKIWQLGNIGQNSEYV